MRRKLGLDNTKEKYKTDRGERPGGGLSAIEFATRALPSHAPVVKCDVLAVAIAVRAQCVNRVELRLGPGEYRQSVRACVETVCLVVVQEIIVVYLVVPST